MSLVVALQSVPALVRRHESEFGRARRGLPTLARYPTAEALLDALSLGSPTPLDERQELVRTLVHLHRGTHHPLWSALLLHAFRPMLLSLRARDRGPKDDRGSRVLLAFFQALECTPVEGQPVFLALRRATARAVFQAVRAELVHAETMALETGMHPGMSPCAEPSPFVKCLAREVAERIRSAWDAPRRKTRAPPLRRVILEV